MTEMINQFYLAGIHEKIQDSDYSRFPWGGKVTEEVITAAAVITAREDRKDAPIGEVIRVMARGWIEYSDLSELALSDRSEGGADQFNTMMSRFEWSGEDRAAADAHNARVLIKEAREQGRQVVFFEDDDVPSGFKVEAIYVFNKER